MMSVNSSVIDGWRVRWYRTNASTRKSGTAGRNVHALNVTAATDSLVTRPHGSSPRGLILWEQITATGYHTGRSWSIWPHP